MICMAVGEINTCWMQFIGIDNVADLRCCILSWINDHALIAVIGRNNIAICAKSTCWEGSNSHTDLFSAQ